MSQAQTGPGTRAFLYNIFRHTQVHTCARFEFLVLSVMCINEGLLAKCLASRSKENDYVEGGIIAYNMHSGDHSTRQLTAGVRGYH